MINRLSLEQLKPDTQAWTQYIQAHTPLASASFIDLALAKDTVMLSLQQETPYSQAFIAVPEGTIVQDFLEQLAQEQTWSKLQAIEQAQQHNQSCYLANPQSPYEPFFIRFEHSLASVFIDDLEALITQPYTGEALKQQVHLVMAKHHLDAYFQPYIFLNIVEAYIKQYAQNQLQDSSTIADFAVLCTPRKKAQSPYIHVAQASYKRLFGELFSVSGHSPLSTIRLGEFVRHNGHIFVLHANDLLQDKSLWNAIYHLMLHQDLDWDLLTKQQEKEPTIRPENMYIVPRIKLLLVGQLNQFYRLQEQLPHFYALFPYCADFEMPLKITPEHLPLYLNYIHYLIEKAGSLPFNKMALIEFLLLSTRLAGHQQELSFNSVLLLQILQEINLYARQEQGVQIEPQHIQRYRHAAKQRNKGYLELSQRDILDDQIYIVTDGKKTGQINGLTYIELGHYGFGEPIRITANVHSGDGEVIDIERRSELGGSLHSKGVLILTAYLTELLAQQEPLPYSVSLVFEQSYGEVDGDSASLAELCCILSAFSRLPIYQHLAVTGSVDQFGQVQSIGAVNEKIESFFLLCQSRGLTGKQGVIIPKSNIQHLHLDTELQQAIQEKKFHIFAVSHVSEAIQLLTGVPFDTDDGSESVLSLCDEHIHKGQASRYLKKRGLFESFFSKK